FSGDLPSGSIGLGSIFSRAMARFLGGIGQFWMLLDRIQLQYLHIHDSHGATLYLTTHTP
ncbi:MAG: hypothetical protein LW720_18150, partial [Pirellula sp.]|nr:hypothetical protein [Pirellula sp.]